MFSAALYGPPLLWLSRDAVSCVLGFGVPFSRRFLSATLLSFPLNVLLTGAFTHGRFKLSIIIVLHVSLDD